MRFFCQVDVDNHPYSNSLYRYREEAELIYEEHWCPTTNTWDQTSYLTRLLTGGDCTLAEVTQDFAKTLMISKS